jgi:hypothetical protein
VLWPHFRTFVVYSTYQRLVRPSNCGSALWVVPRKGPRRHHVSEDAVRSRLVVTKSLDRQSGNGQATVQMTLGMLSVHASSTALWLYTLYNMVSMPPTTQDCLRRRLSVALPALELFALPISLVIQSPILLTSSKSIPVRAPSECNV